MQNTMSLVKNIIIMNKTKEEIKLEIRRAKEEVINLKWSGDLKNDDFKHINYMLAIKILLNPKYFDESTGILDLSKTKYQVIDEFIFHSKNIKKVILPKSIVVIGKYSFANNEIEELDFSKNTNLEIIEDYSFAYNNINKFKNAPNILLYTKKAMFENPITKTFKN